jgi:hypothetical protein
MKMIKRTKKRKETKRQMRDKLDIISNYYLLIPEGFASYPRVLDSKQFSGVKWGEW